MRRWSLLALMPCLVACAAVLGLEEAQLDEDDDSVGGKTSTGGQSNRAGKTGNIGGEGGAPSCSYDESGDPCFWGCVNDTCCSEWVSCFDDPRSPACADYFGCRTACDGDSDCELACARSHAVGFARAAALSQCMYSGNCPCLDEAGGGEGGTPPIFGGRSGGGRGGVAGGPPRGGTGGSSAGGAPPARGGTGGSGGSSGPPPGGTGGTCSDDTPAACINSTTLGYCEGGKRQTISCSEACTALGYDSTGAMCDDVCSCGPALYPECYSGTQVECVCNFASACTTAQGNQIYGACFRDSPAGTRDYIECLHEYSSTTSDCQILVPLCGGSGPPPPP